MKESIKHYALNCGFDAVGVSRPTPQTWGKYVEWLERGYHGEMGYLENRCEQRNDLSTVLGMEPGSVIVLAKNYLTVEPNEHDALAPIVSRYAWGEDYHALMGESAKRVCEWIEDEYRGHKARWCVDTAPVLERDFAAQAGIGWVGKHTNLLSKKLGNWFFLGAIITTLPLEEDEPVHAHCGTCSKCLDVCPTRAFVGPYTLDARRCISYLTIELKGPIPRELRPMIGRRIFGCDDCLEVCPWNRFASPTKEEGFCPTAEWETVDLIGLMEIDQKTFSRWFKGTPIKRTKRRGLLRNTAVALGNCGDVRAVDVLIKAMQDHETLIRGHAAWALGQLKCERSYQALLRYRDLERDLYVQEEIDFAVGCMKGNK